MQQNVRYYRTFISVTNIIHLCFQSDSKPCGNISVHVKIFPYTENFISRINISFVYGSRPYDSRIDHREQKKREVGLIENRNIVRRLQNYRKLRIV